MSASKPNQPPNQAFDDVLAKMMQAEVNEGGPPPPTPCDTPVTVISQIHMADPKQPSVESDGAWKKAKKEFEEALTEHLNRLGEEIQAARTKGAALGEAAKARWGKTIAELEAKQKAAHAKLDEVGHATGNAWEHLRDAARHAWQELEHAIQKARSEF